MQPFRNPSDITAAAHAEPALPTIRILPCHRQMAILKATVFVQYIECTHKLYLRKSCFEQGVRKIRCFLITLSCSAAIAQRNQKYLPGQDLTRIAYARFDLSVRTKLCRIRVFRRDQRTPLPLKDYPDLGPDRLPLHRRSRRVRLRRLPHATPPVSSSCAQRLSGRPGNPDCI